MANNWTFGGRKSFKSRLGGNYGEEEETNTPDYVEETISDPGPLGTTYQDYQETVPQSNMMADPDQYLGPYAGEAWDYWKDASASPGYTPEQINAMRSQALTAQTSANAGMADRIREMLAAKGLGGGGYENSSIARQMLGSEANLQNALTQQALGAAEAERMGRQYYAGLGGQMAGTFGNQRLGLGQLDLQRNQQAADMYRWGQETDYDRMMNALNKDYYDEQNAEYEARLNDLFGPSGNRPGVRGLNTGSLPINRNKPNPFWR